MELASPKLWIVRHGERLDETPGGDWHKYPAFTWFDPPITIEGTNQAKEAACTLKQELSSALPSIIFTSPLLRAAQTAVVISEAFGGVPCKVIPGLAQCAKAMKDSKSTLPLLDDASIRLACPSINLLDRDVDAPRTFFQAAQWLARLPSENVLCVCHREGIRDLACRHLTLPYCCYARFEGGVGDSCLSLALLQSRDGVSIPFKDLPMWKNVGSPEEKPMSSPTCYGSVTTLDASNFADAFECV